jgi:hypothetical protein
MATFVLTQHVHEIATSIVGLNCSSTSKKCQTPDSQGCCISRPPLQVRTALLPKERSTIQVAFEEL